MLMVQQEWQKISKIKKFISLFSVIFTITDKIA